MNNVNYNICVPTYSVLRQTVHTETTGLLLLSKQACKLVVNKIEIQLQSISIVSMI